MFANCGSVTDISLMFYNNSGTIRFFSPSHSGENVTVNNGLFSPLASLETYDRVFNGYTIYADRFVLRRVSDSYAIKRLDGFTVRYILDDVNSYTYGTIPSYSINAYGNLTNFFKNLINLSGDVKALFSNTLFINFSTLADTSCKIPDNITILRACFTSTYGMGEISLSSYFSPTTKLQRIYQSFITNEVFNGYYPSMTLSNKTFERFVPRSDGYSGLLEVGYNRDNTSYPVAGPLGSSFSGVIYKDFGSSFPYNIFSELPGLTMASGVFMNAHGSVDNLQLPGRLFEKNKNLIDCSAEFYNLDNDYTLSSPYTITYDWSGSKPKEVISISSGSPNFIYCTKLVNVSYMFGAPSGDTFPHLSGQIPRNFF